MTRIHFALLILSSAVLALRCVPADPTPVIDHTATVAYLPEETPEEEPTPATEQRAYVVVQCKNPNCPTHGPWLANVKELESKGWNITVLSVAENKAQVEALPIEGDKYPYVVITRDGKAVAGKFLDTAHAIGTWLNENGPWPVAETHSAPAVSSLLDVVVVTSPTCPPCKVLKRDAAEINAEVGCSLRFVESGYAVDVVPTTIVLMDGKEIDRTTGYSGKRGFCRWLKNVAEKHGGRWK